jgi:orotidine-5'-phosphate decarboxylase
MRIENDAERIIVAYDFRDEASVRDMNDKLKGSGVRAKVGLELTTAIGVPQALRLFEPRSVFLDLKYKDIPNTVAGAVRAASWQGAWMVNVHCDGGPGMMGAAVSAARESEESTGYRPFVTGVTVLTSLTRQMLDELNIKESLTVPQLVGSLAALAAKCGLDGVVCSPREAREVRSRVPDGFLIVTPGIRGKNDPPDDQNRTATVREAILAGSDCVVIGRPITKAADPAAAAARFIDEVRSARAELGKAAETV